LPPPDWKRRSQKGRICPMEHLLRPTKYAQNQPHARFFVTSALLSSGLASGVSCHWASPNAWLANEEAAGLNGDFSTDVHAACQLQVHHRAPAERTEISGARLPCRSRAIRQKKDFLAGTGNSPIWGVFGKRGSPSLPCIELEWGPVKRIVKSTASK